MRYPKEVTEVIKVLKKLKNIKAISLIGSWALGFADEYTNDFEMMTFCDEIPRKEMRKRLLKSVIKKWNSAYVSEKFDVFDIGKLKDCSIKYEKVEVFKYFIKEFEEEKECHEPLMDIFYSKPLYDPEKILKKWKNIIKKYPDWFRISCVRNLTAIFRLTRSGLIEKEMKRRNINFLNDKVAQAKTMLEKVVFALNRTYFHPKWTFKFYRSFKLLPKDFIEELNKFNDPRGISLKEKIKILDHLASEVYELAKREIPSLIVMTKFE